MPQRKQLFKGRQRSRSLRRRGRSAVAFGFAILFFVIILALAIVIRCLVANDRFFLRQTTPSAVASPSTFPSLPRADVWMDLLATVNKEKLTRIASDLNEQYASAQPFPHVVIDSLFPSSILDAVLEENPESLIQSNGCLPHKPLCAKASVGDPQFHKSAVNQEEKMGPYTRMLAAFFKSGIFVDFLKELTGIRGLVPDPLFNGGGVHFTSNEGKLDIHSDFNQYPGPKLERRVNTFLFFNPDWQEEYGGHLELWSRNMSLCQAQIAPLLGRFVVFTTSDFSFHGHPHPLTAPFGRSRRSMANYYYTVGRPAGDCATKDCKQHGTLWRSPTNGCMSCLDSACNGLPVKQPVYVA